VNAEPSSEWSFRARTASTTTTAVSPGLNVTGGGAVLAVEVGLGVGFGVALGVGLGGAGEDGGLAGGSGNAVGAWVVAVTGDVVAAGKLEPLLEAPESVGAVPPTVQPASAMASPMTSTRPLSLVDAVIANASAPGRRG
jgi:hypothetical protein